MSDDKVITVMCAARLSELLVRRIDAAAKSGGISRAQFIADACRMHLDGSVGVAATPSVSKTESAGSSPAAPATLRDICADHEPRSVRMYRDLVYGKIKFPVFNPDEFHDTVYCGKTWWEDGEQYQCLMDKGHREAVAGKHGLRGMVRRLDA